MKISVRVLSEKVRIGLNNYKKMFKPIASKTLLDGMEKVRKKILGNFPGGVFGGYDIPFRDDQTYERTGRLGRSTWLEGEIGSGDKASVKFISQTEYSKFVLGDASGEGQAWMHVGRWPNAYEEISDAVEDMTLGIDESLDNLAQQEGLTAND